MVDSSNIELKQVVINSSNYDITVTKFNVMIQKGRLPRTQASAPSRGASRK